MDSRPETVATRVALYRPNAFAQFLLIPTDYSFKWTTIELESGNETDHYQCGFTVERSEYIFTLNPNPAITEAQHLDALYAST